MKLFQAKREFTALLRAILRLPIILCAIVLPLLLPAQTNFAVLVNDGAWTWFNDPRAVFHNGNLYFGYVRDSDGSSCLNLFNLQSGQTTNLWVSSRKETDDHDVCGLLTKQDGTMLAIYSRHQTDQFFTYRLSTSTNPVTPADWGPEHTNTTPFASQGMTYSNPYQLTNEAGKVYNFARNQNYNPCVFTSTNGGSNWTAAQIVIQTGSGSTRPYVKYCSDYNSRIDFLYTDAHPDNYTNSLYHMYYQGGAFYKTDGTFLKSYANLPILHDSGERGTVIYQYSDAFTNDPNQWIPTGRAWCWEIGYQTNGAPVCVFQAKVDNVTGTSWSDARIYYYYARWTGTNWQKRFIAQAGRPLYNGQPDYGGGMALDPQDPNTIYISTDAATPFDLSSTTNATTVALGANYQIWKGVTADGGLTFTWQPITGNSTVDNLRPYIPRRFGGEPCVLWFRGTYTSYTSFNTQVVGLFTTAVPAVTNSTGLPVPAAIPPAQIKKANNPTSLNQGASWIGGNAPGAGNVAVWDSTVTAANSVALGANASWAGILVTNPGGAVNITSGNTLTLGASGINMSGATANLTISSGLTLSACDQIWNVTNNRMLSLNAGAFTRSNGATLNIQGAGTVTSSMTGFNSTDATIPSPGIIGPWVTIGRGTSAHYATTNGGNIVTYTGFSGPFNWSTSVPNFTNFEISTASVPLGIDRMCNTIRWTGGTATQNYGSGSSANRLFVRGILNAGTGVLTFAKASGTPTFIPGTSAGANRELVLNAAAAGLVMGVPIADNAGGASSVVVTGSDTNTVTLNVGNTYTGGTTLNAGELILGNAGGLGDSSGALAINGGTLELGGFSSSFGAVTMNGGVIQDGTLTAASFAANNPNSAGVSAVLAGASATLTQNGSGILSLTAQNTYGGMTTVNAGTLNLLGGISGPVTVAGGMLDGDGTISGAVTNQSGGVIAPGVNANSIGTLIINNSLVLQPGGTTAIKVSKNGDGIVNDSVVGLVGVTYGGALTVTNIGPVILTVGDSIKIFSAASYQGRFASISPSTPGTGLIWNTNSLTANGTLSVALGNVSPQFNSASVLGSNLNFSGSGGAAGAGFSILTSTNLALPLANWSLVFTGTFDNAGNFSFTNSIDPSLPWLFYEIRIP